MVTGVLGQFAQGTRPWEDIPGVVLVGIIVGLGFLVVAIRMMFGKRK